LRRKRINLQGEKSKEIGAENELMISRLISENKPTFSELLVLSGLSRPILAKHLKSLLKVGFIFKDTVKPKETDDRKRIGRIVYKVNSSVIDDFMKHFVEVRVKISDLGLSEEMKKQLQMHYDAIAEIWSKYLKEMNELPIGEDEE
jgi:hypothetical protein